MKSKIAVLGIALRDKFLNVTEYYNVLKWDPPTSGSSPPVAYRIFRGSLSHLIGTVSANGKLKFVDKNTKATHSPTLLCPSMRRAINHLLLK